MITLYNLKPEKLGLVDSVSSFSTENTRVYDGFEISANARIKGGGFLIGSITTDRVAVNNCDVANSDPNGLRFCQQTPPFRGLYKLSASYPLPWDIKAERHVPAAAGQPDRFELHVQQHGRGCPADGRREPHGCVGGSDDPVLRLHQADGRARGAHLQTRRHERLQAFVEIFNLPNVSTVLTVNETYGPLWLQPQIIDQPRHFQFGAQLDF